jgi:hypothetical protein
VIEMLNSTLSSLPDIQLIARYSVMPISMVLMISHITYPCIFTNTASPDATNVIGNSLVGPTTDPFVGRNHIEILLSLKPILAISFFSVLLQSVVDSYRLVTSYASSCRTNLNLSEIIKIQKKSYLPVSFGLYGSRVQYNTITTATATAVLST